jgi:hypothetical protein
MHLPSHRTIARTLSQIAVVWLLVLLASHVVSPFGAVDLNLSVMNIAQDDDGAGDAANARNVILTVLPLFVAAPSALAGPPSVFLQDSAFSLASPPRSRPRPLRI